MNAHLNAMLRKRVDLVWIGSIFGLIYWVWQSFRDAMILEKATFVQSLVSPDMISLAMRILVISVFILLCIHAKYVQEKVLEEKTPLSSRTAIFAVILSAIGFVMLYWILDSFQDILIQSKGEFVERLFTPGLTILISRFLSVLFIITLIFFIHYLFVSRRKAEKALQEAHDNLTKSRENLNKIVSNDIDGIFVIDNENKIVFVNPAAEQMFQKPVYEWIGRPLNHPFSTESEQEYEIANEKGEKLVVETLAVRIDWQGEKATLVSMRDITERKRVEQMRENFLSLISHRLKSPVVGIMEAIDNMLEGFAGTLTDKQREYLLVMQDNVKTKFDMIEDLLTVMQLETKGETVRIGDTVLADVVEGAVQKFRPEIEKKGLSLDLKKMDKQLIVRADAKKLKKVIQNVLHNAIKFTHEGAITIRTESEPGRINLMIEDTGRGMSDAVLESLFSRDANKQSLMDARTGMGFGLYMAKKFMQLQHGDIVAASTPDRGSCFAIQIPVQN